METEQLFILYEALRLDGEYSFNGLRIMNPVMCSECSWSQESSTFTVNGVSKKIYLGALVDGTKLADASKQLEIATIW